MNCQISSTILNEIVRGELSLSTIAKKFNIPVQQVYELYDEDSDHHDDDYLPNKMVDIKERFSYSIEIDRRQYWLNHYRDHHEDLVI